MEEVDEIIEETTKVHKNTYESMVEEMTSSNMNTMIYYINIISKRKVIEKIKERLEDGSSVLELKYPMMLPFKMRAKKFFETDNDDCLKNPESIDKLKLDDFRNEDYVVYAITDTGEEIYPETDLMIDILAHFENEEAAIEREKRYAKTVHYENEDIIITDPCYIINKENDDDWGRCDYSENMEVLGLKNYIARNTIYGDWSCTTYNSDTKEAIGEFCADAGLVGVFSLKEVLAYNPKFDYHTERTWTTTLIKNFTGDVHFEVIHTEGVY